MKWLSSTCKEGICLSALGINRCWPFDEKFFIGKYFIKQSFWAVADRRSNFFQCCQGFQCQRLIGAKSESVHSLGSQPIRNISLFAFAALEDCQLKHPNVKAVLMLVSDRLNFERLAIPKSSVTYAKNRNRMPFWSTESVLQNLNKRTTFSHKCSPL